MRSPRVLATSVTAALAVLVIAGTASAQDAPAQPPPAQPAPSGGSTLPPIAADAKPQTPPPVTPSRRAVDADDDADDPNDEARDDRDDEDRGKRRHRHKESGEDRARFRGGVSAYGGAYLFGGFAIPYGGVEGRLGAQIRDWVAVYAEPAFLLGGRLGETGGSVVARVSLGVIPEFTVADLWFIGLGPEVYAVAGGGHSTIDNTTGFFASASYVGINGRTGFAFGSKRPGRRKCFTLAFDGRVDFFGGHPGFAPALSLGYDAM